MAPPIYKATFETSKGAFVVEVHRDYAPLGADRFYNLVKNGFYDDTRFFRVISGFMVHFGINGDPKISAPWRDAQIKDDPVKQSNKRASSVLPRPAPIRAPPRPSSISETMVGSTAQVSRPSAKSRREWASWTPFTAVMARERRAGGVQIRVRFNLRAMPTS
jgi:cyclophilin family peptidyl-prolyl cis-trans isomerase